MYVIIGSHFVPLEGKLNNGVSIVQKPVGKLSITSTTFLPQVEITLSK
jgi:hypothetical protein